MDSFSFKITNIYRYSMNMQLSITNTKLDICFANSLNSVKNGYIRQASLHLLQFLAMIIMIPIDIYVFKHSN